MAGESTETQLALLKQWRDQVEVHMSATDKKITELEDERTRGLKWGVVTLGLGVFGMGAWIWNFVVSHIK